MNAVERVRRWRLANPERYRDYNKAHYQKTKERTREYHRAWRVRNGDRTRAKDRQWRQKNLETKRETDRLYAASHRREALAKAKRWYAANKERKRRYDAEYRRINKARREATIRAWNKLHVDRLRFIRARRRARLTGSPTTHTEQEWVEKVALLAGCCAYCGEEKQLTRDHKTPLSRGGTDDISNIVPACRSCNSRKRHLTTPEFLEWLNGS
jgi:5-methylcytosine-specific restriction endonuclease McrA